MSKVNNGTVPSIGERQRREKDKIRARCLALAQRGNVLVYLSYRKRRVQPGVPGVPGVPGQSGVPQSTE